LGLPTDPEELIPSRKPDFLQNSYNGSYTEYEVWIVEQEGHPLLLKRWTAQNYENGKRYTDAIFNSWSDAAGTHFGWFNQDEKTHKIQMGQIYSLSPDRARLTCKSYGFNANVTAGDPTGVNLRIEAGDDGVERMIETGRPSRVLQLVRDGNFIYEAPLALDDADRAAQERREARAQRREEDEARRDREFQQGLQDVTRTIKEAGDSFAEANRRDSAAIERARGVQDQRAREAQARAAEEQRRRENEQQERRAQAQREADERERLAQAQREADERARREQEARPKQDPIQRPGKDPIFNNPTALHGRWQRERDGFVILVHDIDLFVDGGVAGAQDWGREWKAWAREYEENTGEHIQLSGPKMMRIKWLGDGHWSADELWCEHGPKKFETSWRKVSLQLIDRDTCSDSLWSDVWKRVR
jgi:hypothetical protein